MISRTQTLPRRRSAIYQAGAGQLSGRSRCGESHPPQRDSHSLLSDRSLSRRHDDAGGQQDADAPFKSLTKGALLPISALALLMPLLSTAVSGLVAFDDDGRSRCATCAP
jgi:hypothetical protein